MVNIQPSPYFCFVFRFVSWSNNYVEFGNRSIYLQAGILHTEAEVSHIVHVLPPPLPYERTKKKNYMTSILKASK